MAGFSWDLRVGWGGHTVGLAPPGAWREAGMWGGRRVGGCQAGASCVFPDFSFLLVPNRQRKPVHSDHVSVAPNPFSFRTFLTPAPIKDPSPHAWTHNSHFPPPLCQLLFLLWPLPLPCLPHFFLLPTPLGVFLSRPLCSLSSSSSLTYP